MPRLSTVVEKGSQSAVPCLYAPVHAHVNLLAGGYCQNVLHTNCNQGKHKHLRHTSG